MTSAVSSQMMMPPMGRMPHGRPSEDATSTASTASTNSTDTTAATSSTDSTTTSENAAPEGFEGFAGKFPNFGGGSMGGGFMPPFGQRETFL